MIFWLGFGVGAFCAYLTILVLLFAGADYYDE